MERITTKTARFAKVVQQCGSPQTLTLWMDPKRDKKLSAAIKANRVMTIVRERTGSAKEFGLVGLLERPAATYLLFPKSLSAYANTRIVGIKYDLITEPDAAKSPWSTIAGAGTSSSSPLSKPVGRAGMSSSSSSKAQPLIQQKQPPKAPTPQSFEVHLRASATLKSTLKISAMTATDAKRKALESYAPETNQLNWHKSVLKVRKLKNQP